MDNDVKCLFPKPDLATRIATKLGAQGYFDGPKEDVDDSIEEWAGDVIREELAAFAPKIADALYYKRRLAEYGPRNDRKERLCSEVAEIIQRTIEGDDNG